MLLGKRVITPDNEQGFVSDVYADNLIDVDILDENPETAEHTTSYTYDKADVAICVDQTPRLRDITPFGQVKMLGILADGIIEVVLDTGCDTKSTLWICEHRYNTLPDKLKPKWGHWTEPSEFSKWIAYYDFYFNDDGCIDPKPLIHDLIPHEAHLRVELCDGETAFWNARVGENGKVDFVKTDAGEKLTTLAELRAMDIKSAELQCSYNIADFDR